MDHFIFCPIDANLTQIKTQLHCSVYCVPDVSLQVTALSFGAERQNEGNVEFLQTAFRAATAERRTEDFGNVTVK